jgi:hypothetical protein
VYGSHFRASEPFIASKIVFLNGCSVLNRITPSFDNYSYNSQLPTYAAFSLSTIQPAES